MLKFRLMTSVQSLVMVSVLLLAACGGTPAELITPTANMNVDAIRTEAVSTFASGLTMTALAAPSDTPSPTATAAPTFPPLATSTGGTPFVSGPTAPVASTTGCNGLRFVQDVSVPDNTTMTPGQAFTKTWKVLNAGSCAWEAGTKFAFVGGEQMGGTTQTLCTSVAAGSTFDISVPMTAPTNKTGALRGNWRMSTAAGQFFGDEVYVQIVVGGAAAGTATSTSTGSSATGTATPSATPTATATQ